MGGWLDLERLPRGLGANWIAPSAALRGAVFSSLVFRGRTTRPAYVKPTLVAKYGHVEVLQTAGEQLDQGDLDVFLELCRIGVERDSTRISINADETLKALGRKRGGESRRWLSESVSRLKRASFLFRVPGLHEWETSFLLEFDRNVGTQLVRDYEISLNSRLVALYEKSSTLIRSDKRNALGTDTLAKWLHAFICSFHKGGETVLKVDNVRKLSGREDSRPDRFRVALAESVEHLRKVSGWHEVAIVGDVLKVKQAESATELEAKRAKAAEKKATTPAKPKPTPAPPKPTPPAKPVYESDDELAAEVADLLDSETPKPEDELDAVPLNASDKALFNQQLTKLLDQMMAAGHKFSAVQKTREAWDQQAKEHGHWLAVKGLSVALSRQDYGAEKAAAHMEEYLHDDI